MKPRIEIIKDKKLIGKSIQMSLSHNKTFELWNSFMVKRKEILNEVGNNLFSIQVYPDEFDLSKFNFNTVFIKKAAIEVEDFRFIPNGMESFTLKGGEYAVFLHKGDSTTFPQTLEYIFKTWLPNAEYILDKRPHFEVLGEKYKNHDPLSEEEVWIPIKRKD